MTHPVPSVLIATCMCLFLSACVAPVVVSTGPVSLAATYPDQPAPGPGPATANCAAAADATASETQVIALINAERHARGMGTVTKSPRLTRAAQAHACDNAARNSFSHTGSDGKDLSARLLRQGVKIRTAAENTGVGFETPERAVAFWMKSRDHRANILNPAMTQAGLGRVDSEASTTWVLDLALPR